MSECILWSKNKNKRGYGITMFRGKCMGAHRASWIENYGDIPDGMLVCHKCDNPSCINPEHLFLGTQSENMQDCKRKGRLIPPPHPVAKYCVHGHEFTPDNTKIDYRGRRKCKSCDREWHREKYGHQPRYK